MNGKSIRKRLMRRRDDYRAYITVRLSMRDYGLTEPPEVVFDGMSADDGFRGWWSSADERERIRIGLVESGSHPRDVWHEKSACFITSIPGGWLWWEGVRSITHDDGTITCESVSEEAIGQHRARRLWFDALDTTEHPILRQFAQAASWFGGNLWEVNGDDLFLTYTVKWKRFYGDRKLRLSAALSRAMKAAKRAGVTVRVMRSAQ